MKIKIKDGSNSSWAAYQVLNTKNPINGMSISTDGGVTWVDMAGPEDTPPASGGWFMKPDDLILNNVNGSENYKIRVEADTGNIIVDMVGVVSGGETEIGRNNVGGEDCNNGSGPSPSTDPTPVPSTGTTLPPSSGSSIVPSPLPTIKPSPNPSIAPPPGPTLSASPGSSPRPSPTFSQVPSPAQSPGLF